jgi:hypothetical protein
MNLKKIYLFSLIFVLVTIEGKKPPRKKNDTKKEKKLPEGQIPLIGDQSRSKNDASFEKYSANDAPCPHCQRNNFNWYSYLDAFKIKYNEYIDSLKLRSKNVVKKGIITVEDVCKTIFSKIVITKSAIDSLLQWAHE